MKDLIVVRGAGDLATGVICRLYNAGFPVVALESERPSAIRRRVALSEAVYEGFAIVEEVMAKRISDEKEVPAVLAEGKVPLLVDRTGACIPRLKPVAVVDAIVAKKISGQISGWRRLLLRLVRDFTPEKMSMRSLRRCGDMISAAFCTTEPLLRIPEYLAESAVLIKSG